jgi:hypothetical protein
MNGDNKAAVTSGKCQMKKGENGRISKEVHERCHPRNTSNTMHKSKKRYQKGTAATGHGQRIKEHAPWQMRTKRSFHAAVVVRAVKGGRSPRRG